MKLCSCLVNARACHETELNFHPTKAKKKIAVVGPPGSGKSVTLSLLGLQRLMLGHYVCLLSTGDSHSVDNLALKNKVSLDIISI